MAKRPFELPSVQEFRALRDFLVAQGLTTAQVAQFIGAAPQNRPIGTIASDLRAKLKTLPKASPPQP